MKQTCFEIEWGKKWGRPLLNVTLTTESSMTQYIYPRQPNNVHATNVYWGYSSSLADGCLNLPADWFTIYPFGGISGIYGDVTRLCLKPNNLWLFVS